MVPSSWDHRGRRLRTHMAARALQNLGLDSTGCGGGTRGLNYSPRDTIYRAPTTPLVRSMSSWESLLFLLPGARSAAQGPEIPYQGPSGRTPPVLAALPSETGYRAPCHDPISEINDVLCEMLF